MAVYTEQDINKSCFDEAVSLLNKAQYLTESESTYHAEMVPIKENTRLGKKMVRLEDFVDYASSNGITNGSQTINDISAASKITTESIAFSVDEVSILEDLNMEETVRQLVSAGADVYTAPISESNVAYVLAEACYKAMRSSNDPAYAEALFEAYVNDDFETYLSDEGVKAQLQKNKKFNEASTEIAMDESADDPIKWISEQIASLRSVKNNYLTEGDKLLNLVQNGIAYLDSVRKENI